MRSAYHNAFPVPCYLVTLRRRYLPKFILYYCDILFLAVKCLSAAVDGVLVLIVFSCHFKNNVSKASVRDVVVKVTGCFKPEIGRDQFPIYHIS
jgi:hypothetical protein